MKNALKSISCHRSCASSASVVDGKLILSFPGALVPVVWQMDLTQAKASALEVHDTKTGFALVLKNPKPETVDIATFAKREDAVNGLMAASRALAGAHGQIRPNNEMSGVTTIHTINKPGSVTRLLGAVLGLAFLVALFGFWASMAPRPPASMDTATGNTTSSTNSGQNEPGMPMSADDFLKGR